MMAFAGGRRTQETAGQLLDILYDSWKAQAIHAFAQLRVADHLSGEPKSSAAVASAIQCDEGALHRLLRAGCTLGLVAEEAGVFRLTEMGSLLTEDSPDSIRYWALWWGSALWPVWGNLTYSVRTGESARKMLSGVEGFAHMENDPEAAHTFNRGLAEITRFAAQSIVRSFDFSRFATIMDLGGGYGQLLAAILQECQNSQGILVDLPHSIEGAEAQLAAFGGRCRCLAGDFFESIPAQADAVVLKSVIHDWNDEDALRILRVCRRDMRPDAKLILIERMMPAQLNTSHEHQVIARMDLIMLAAHGAKERSEEDLKALVSQAGLTCLEVTPTDSGFSILVAEL